jgi:hypothetical protein
LPSQPLDTDAFVLQKRPAADAFQTFTFFSAREGQLTALLRVGRPVGGTSRRGSSTGTPPLNLDLFDEVALKLESSNQGRTWFIREARLIHRTEGIGRDYEALKQASRLASLVARNPPDEEGRPRIAALLRAAFDGFASGADPGVVFFKSLYCLARDEGHPVRQHWLAGLTAAQRASAERILSNPLADLETNDASRRTVARLQGSLETYLAGHTELLLSDG